MQVKSRHHLRSDAVSALEDTLEAQLGVSPEGDAYERVEFEDTDWEVVLIDGEPQVAYFDEEPFLTVRGANAYDPDKRLVTVDAGAVSFVSDGADVMRPGITEATDDISPDDLVVIAEESHGKVLAVGRARVDGTEMAGDEGKVVDSLHHVGDDLYEFTG
ncbi:RNA-binding protein [Natrinema pellirubrum DSM 15624]|uniref:PUA-domain protein n=1 Tax=Natrinema pellirubrum (strain DSM 15624 / CIP 106293 / JCM 10476 / NCIMB 786 / 157) TaxID=797303 RepID=L0JH50_NATP1|nr:RNA-binding protein [Natrinema pellirubrum]AGB30644.1 PUA-domain protein [Natrinema pellirubrum DSM 15624]ELY74881.1 RNA-binding protein [Natrinema pellirubrum DSM 15624]